MSGDKAWIQAGERSDIGAAQQGDHGQRLTLAHRRNAGETERRGGGQKGAIGQPVDCGKERSGVRGGGRRAPLALSYTPVCPPVCHRMTWRARVASRHREAGTDGRGEGGQDFVDGLRELLDTECRAFVAPPVPRHARQSRAADSALLADTRSTVCGGGNWARSVLWNGP